MQKTPENVINALIKVRVFTRETYDLYDLAGNYNSKVRAELMTILSGVKVPASKSGINALRSEFYRVLEIPAIECENSREHWFRQVAHFLVCQSMSLGGVL